MIWMVIASFLILTLFITWITVREKDIPQTISEIYYLITHKGLFTLTIWTCAILLLIPCIETWESSVKIIPILSVFGLGLVGVAPRFKEEGERKIHIVGAAISGIGALLMTGWRWQLSLILIPIIGIIITAGRLKNGENFGQKLDAWDYMFWVETACFLILYTTLIDKLT